MKTYKIEQEQLKEVLKEALIDAYNFDWTGWRIPVYYNEETGKVSSGSWLSNNSYQPDAIELPVKIERWTIDDIEEPTDEDIEFIADDAALHIIDDEIINGYYDDSEYEFEII